MKRKSWWGVGLFVFIGFFLLLLFFFGNLFHQGKAVSDFPASSLEGGKSEAIRSFPREEGGHKKSRLSGRKPVAEEKKPRGIIKGLVLFGQKPVPSALVYALPSRGEGKAVLEREKVGASVPSFPEFVHPLSEVHTNKEGVFALNIPQKWQTKTIDLVVFEPGFLRGGVRNIVPRDIRTRLLVILHKGLAIRGFIKDEKGQAIGGLKVFATTDFKARGRNLRCPRNYKRQIKARPYLKTPFCFSEARSEQDGSFVIKGLEPGSYVLNVEGGPWTMKEHPTVFAGSENVQLTIVPAYHLLLAVKSEKERAPIPRFKVNASWHISDEESQGMFLVGFRGRLDFFYSPFSQGKTLKEGLPVSLEIQAPGFFHSSKEVVLYQKEAEPIEVLLRKKNLKLTEIKVFDAFGNPTSDFKAWIAAQGDRNFRPIPVRHKSKDVGFLEVPQGRWLLRIRSTDSFPLGTPWQRLFSFPLSPKARLIVHLKSDCSLQLDLRGLSWQSEVKSVLFQSAKGVLQLPRPRNSRNGLLRWVQVPPGEWNVEIHGKKKSLKKKVRVKPGLNLVVM